MKPFFAIIVSLLFTHLVWSVPPDRSKPNVVLFFADDLGYGDLGIYGAKGYETPNLDRLAHEGMMFTSFYSAQAVCSASRAALLTGCYPNRIGITGALSPNASIGIHEGEMTMAEMLKQKGYKTCIVGKWHLGHHKKFLPLQHGFDEYFGLPYSNDMWPVDYDGIPFKDKNINVNRASYPPLPLISGNEPLDTIESMAGQDMLTSRYTEKAIDFIRKNSGSPFFLYLPYAMPHVPLGVSPRFKGRSQQGRYGDVIMELDASVGEILKTLKDLKLDKNTLIIFTSDNGPWINFGNHAGNTGGLREGKGTSFEGGQRVPCIMKWDGVIPQGRVCNQLASTLDIMVTLSSITRSTLPNHRVDGVDLSALLQGKDVSPRTEFYYYYNKNSLEAVRRGTWKLVLPHRYRSYVGVLPSDNGMPGKYASDSTGLALFDLRRDPGEVYDVKEMYPDKVKELLGLADKARKDLGDDITGKEGENVRMAGKM